MNRKLFAERLRSDLGALASCCHPNKAKGTLWPPAELLQSVEDSVMLLIATERKKRPSPAWKGFQLLDKRMPSVRLALRVNSLVKHARERLEQVSESELDKLARQERDDARKLLRDIATIRDSQDAARKINWAQHERALAQFSHTRSVEPAYGRSAPLEIRCYARALELIVDDYRRKPLRNKSRPLLKWLAHIEHPQANSLLALDREAADLVEREQRALQEATTSRKREKDRHRVRKHREWHKGKWVYLGDWLRFRRDEKDRLKWGFPAKPKCEPCGKSSLDEQYWWFHRVRHVVRCRACQEAEWWADGYEIDEFGNPDSLLGEEATRWERIAERERHLGSHAPDWLQTPKGQEWLQKAKRRFAKLQAKRR